jgi:Protein of unknown function (DUF3500)
MTERIRPECPECCPETPSRMGRREFARRVGGLAAAGIAMPWLAPRVLGAVDVGPSTACAAESAARRLFEGLKSEQKEILCFPYDHELRNRINANWAITKPTIGEMSEEQQAIVQEIVKGVTSPDGYERLVKQTDDDAGGLPEYHVAFFGTPDGPFEFELTGRHLTLRADGNSAPGAAFGGPIIYGHGVGDGEKGLPGNVFYYQTQKANEVFKALDGGQRDKALVEKAPSEGAVQIKGDRGRFPGIGVGDLSSDQKELVQSVIRVLLDPYRKEDVDEAMSVIESGGGMDALHMAFYKADDLGDDQEWDIWRLEGPTFVWHFRGAPHVHAYINVAKKA